MGQRMGLEQGKGRWGIAEVGKHDYLVAGGESHQVHDDTEVSSLYD